MGGQGPMVGPEEFLNCQAKKKPRGGGQGPRKGRSA